MTYPKTLESDANSRTLVDDSVYDCGVKLCRFEILMLFSSCLGLSRGAL